MAPGMSLVGTQSIKPTQGIVGTQGYTTQGYPSTQDRRTSLPAAMPMQESQSLQGRRVSMPSDSMFPSMQGQQPGMYKELGKRPLPNSRVQKLGGFPQSTSPVGFPQSTGTQGMSTRPTYTSEMNQVPTTFPTNTTTGITNSGNGVTGTLRLPLQGQTSGRPAAPQLEGVQTGVKVDTYEDLVEPSLHARRVTGLNRRAMHGATIQGTLSGHEHASDASTQFSFEPNPSASPIANTIVQQAMKIAQAVSQEATDVQDRSWSGPQGVDTLHALFNSGQQADIAQGIASLSTEVRQILARQPTLVEATVPAKVYGDIHGQFRDMLLQLFHFGFPQSHGPQFIFNGDWVDRGAHQIEVVCLVFALKAMYPNRVWIIRGNHEDANQNVFMGPVGFESACLQRFGHAMGPQIFGVICQTFDYLPLACLIGRKILVLHGGIGNGQWTLDQLRATQRPLASDALPTNEMVFNILWSDPIPDDPGQEAFGAHDSPRSRGNGGCSMYNFGRDVTERFCATNQIDMVVRSHQALPRGFGYDVMHGGRCVRVYSARDYEGQGNDGAILSIVQGAGHLLARAQVLRSLLCPKADATPLVDPTPHGSQLDRNPFCM